MGNEYYNKCYYYNFSNVWHVWWWWIISDIFEGITNKNDQLDVALAKSLKDLVKYIKDITEFNQFELKAISLIQTDKYMKDLLGFYIANKKHLKRRHSKEILTALKSISGNVRENQFFRKMLRFRSGTR